MTLPRILVIDDQLSIDPDLRDNFCFACGLLDDEIKSFESKLNNQDGSYLAIASFCSGENEGRNSYEVIEKAVEKGFGNDGPCEWSLILLDVGFGKNDRFGFEVRPRLLDRFPDLPIVMLTSMSQVELEDTSVPYFSKTGIKSHDFKVKLLKHGCLTKEHEEELLQLKRRDIVAKSSAMREILLQAFIFAGTDTSTLLLGETGAGKEVIAKYIHALSSRSAAPFVAKNIAEISKEQLSAELFGVEKKAATEVAERDGIFVQAEKGTLFLDEIGDMPIDGQQAVLRALDGKSITRVGGKRAIPVDIRLLSATSKDMEQLMSNGQFREDLYHRIAPGVIEIPPLRERREDIAPLASHFLDNFQKKNDRTGINFSRDAVEVLEEQPFRGNVRQLRNLVERVAIHKGNNEVIKSQEILREIEKDVKRRQEPATTSAPPPSTPDVKTLTHLEALLENIQVPTSPTELRGKLSSLQNAYGQLIRRLLETALIQMKESHGTDYILPAIKLLLNKNDLKGTSKAYDLLLSLSKTFESSMPVPPEDSIPKDELENALQKADRNRRAGKRPRKK